MLFRSEADDALFAFFPQSKNHTVTQSSFATPCELLTNATTGAQGFDSSYVPVAANATENPGTSLPPFVPPVLPPLFLPSFPAPQLTVPRHAVWTLEITVATPLCESSLPFSVLSPALT